MTARVIVHADLCRRGTGERDAPQPERRHVQVEAATYEAGRDRIREDLTEGWIVASLRVER